ncbi:hypothetical protein [Algicella marina]|uniref:Phage baseplate protein n=1 Tax=Algicella marina TaxID=2683284 RepID=A0A6P1T4P2_9RHOB|nr:hypothetical protein [Algicella marina]QHQ36680.1 hypothetical protein GO499_16620 [Algicella marina]
MTTQLTSSGILTAWEAGAGRRPLDRAIVLLWAAGQHDPADLPLAERDRALLRLRAATFGPVLAARATCPNCREELEMEFTAKALARTLPEAQASVLDLDGEDIPLRPLSSRDLAIAMGGADLRATLRNRLTGRENLPASALPIIDSEIEARAADAELNAELICATCETKWQEALDVPALLWAEVEARALRLLGEVAEIAAALGWSEHEILNLSEPRRAAYLSLARMQ